MSSRLLVLFPALVVVFPAAVEAAEVAVDPVSTSAAYTLSEVAEGASVHGAHVRVARRFAPWLALEGEVGTGIGSRGHRLEDERVRLSLDYKAAAYGVAQVPLARRTDMLLRLGYGVTSVKIDPRREENAPPPEARTVTSWSWAASAGVQHFVREDLGVRVDYTREGRRLSGGDKGADIWSVGLVGRF